jgi:sugar (pentulose or hexulose) kinase
MMPPPGHVLVLDIGKTNVKAALVDTATLVEIDRRTTPNAVLPGPPYPHADTERIWSFLLGALRDLHARHRIDAVVATAHGASAALVGADGKLALPVLDYEHPAPEDLAADYDAVRPDFTESGSPRLERGLNLGAQLFWQSRRFPDVFATATILLWPQYWTSRLSGVAASEVTSLGAHTDLWCPAERSISTQVERLLMH